MHQNPILTPTMRRLGAAARAASLAVLLAFPVFALGPGHAIRAAAQQTAPASVGTDASGGDIVTSPTYKIVPEDVLQISVVDHPDVDRSVPVMTDGTIDYPYVGQINVAGMTVNELKARITKDLSKQFVRPQVLITVSQRKIRTFTINGSVLKSPGDHPLKEGEHVLEAIADAGGLPTDRPEFFSAVILRHDQTIPIDLKRLYANDPTANIALQPNDVIYLQEKEPEQTTIQVVGEVNKPGPMMYPRDGSIITVLQAAGGPTIKALLSKTTIERNGKNIIVDMRDYQRNGFEPSEKLEPGDKLIVPTNKLEYYVLGPVGAGGTHVYPEDKKVTVYSALAEGGLNLEGAELKKTKLVHPKPDGTTETHVLNVEKMWKTGDLATDMPVEPGDSIIVPPSGTRHGPSFTELVALATSVLALMAYFHR